MSQPHLMPEHSGAMSTKSVERLQTNHAVSMVSFKYKGKKEADTFKYERTHKVKQSIKSTQ